MARPPNTLSSVKITITTTPKLALYLSDLVTEEGYGANPSEVARTLIWRALEDLMERNILDRRRGPIAEGGA